MTDQSTAEELPPETHVAIVARVDSLVEADAFTQCGNVVEDAYDTYTEDARRVIAIGRAQGLSAAQIRSRWEREKVAKVRAECEHGKPLRRAILCAIVKTTRDAFDEAIGKPTPAK